MILTDIQLGTDIVSIARLRRGFKRFGLPFFQRFLTEEELAYCQCVGKKTVPSENTTEQEREVFFKRVAGRIALKEAVAKALGVGVTGLGYSAGVPWTSMELVSVSQKPPKLVLTGKALAYANEQQIKQWRVSISHDGENAVATALGLIS